MLKHKIVFDTGELTNLEILSATAGEEYVSSAESIAALEGLDLVLISGQFVGAGKSKFIEALQAKQRKNTPSWTNRELRPSERQGEHKVQASVATMAEKAIEGYFLELEEVRPGVFYATPPDFQAGISYVKDLELKGALRLRNYAPDLPIIVPLPPLRPAPDKQVTEWERRLIDREDFHRRITDKSLVDLENRLIGVVDETVRIEEFNLRDDPRVLFVVNDNLEKALGTMDRFLLYGEKVNQSGIEDHLNRLSEFAATALSQSSGTK